MNQDIKAQWTAALRSGTYQQGLSALHCGDRYCCLGVLCDLHRIATNGPDWQATKVGSVQLYLGENSHLPVEVVQWAGLQAVDPRVNGARVSEWNDGVNGVPLSTFVDIADMIDQYL